MKRVRMANILGGIGIAIGILGNVAFFYQGGRVSIFTLGLYPFLGFALGLWIDKKRGMPDT